MVSIIIGRILITQELLIAAGQVTDPAIRDTDDDVEVRYKDFVYVSVRDM